MRTLLGTMLILFGQVAPALAATGGIVKGTSILLILFLGFAALIIVFQFIPGLVLFFSMLRGIFRKAQKNGADTRDRK